MIPEGLATAVFGWAATYLVHSTLLLIVVLLVTSKFVRDAGWREVLWRCAVLGSLATATAAVTAPVTPLGGRLALTSGTVAAAAPHGLEGNRSDQAAVGRRAGDTRLARESTARGDRAPFWLQATLAVWAGIAALLLGRLLWRNVHYFRSVGAREGVGGRTAAMLADLRRRAEIRHGVRISTGPDCAVPMVLGLREIFLPHRFFTDLGAEEQRAALAHELAHIRRRDPLWQAGFGLLAALLFFQPLIGVARRRLHATAEHICDEWAVRQTGSPVALGRCLTELASWTGPTPLAPPASTAAIAESGATLVDRVRHIASGTHSRPRRRLAPVALGLSFLATTLGAAPAIGFESALPSLSRPHAVTDGHDAAGEMATDTVEIVRDLELLAEASASSQERQESTAALSDYAPHPAAETALVRLLSGATDPRVRAEAAQQLDEFPTATTIEALRAAVLEETHADARDNSLDVLDDFSLPAAATALRRIARDHREAEVRQAALAALSDDRID